MSEWINWEGGEMPVPHGTLVEVTHRDGDTFICRAGEDYAEDWDHDPTWPESGDIMSYRVVNDETT